VIFEAKNYFFSRKKFYFGFWSVGTVYGVEKDLPVAEI